MGVMRRPTADRQPVSGQRDGPNKRDGYRILEFIAELEKCDIGLKGKYPNLISGASFIYLSMGG